MRIFTHKATLALRRLQFTFRLKKSTLEVVKYRPNAPYRTIVYGLDKDKWAYFDAAYPEFQKYFVPINVHVADLRNMLLRRHMGVVLFQDYSRRRFDLAANGLSPVIFYGADAPFSVLEKGEKDAVGFVLDSMADWTLARRQLEIDIMLQGFDFEEHPDLLDQASSFLDRANDVISDGDKCLIIPNIKDISATSELSSNERKEFAAAIAKLKPGQELTVFRPLPSEDVRLQDNFAHFLQHLKRCNTVIVKDHALGLVAALCGRRVIVTGRPFWAGYGITEDLIQIYRSRELTQDEMAAIIIAIQSRYGTAFGEKVEPFDGWSMPLVG
ncbi:hypothetical protein BVC71_02975 [Marivivens niveibacter]|uniref:Uncharacterized protein n=1 Tax=Marivivens niveibacter TaxID=1930667 RepID=A0A251X1K2_9RHOB|nr:hypothetical protein [Marivivens niveibacter]OUD10476.1 hypothetical protein BVC71_02975 [Marivivens niveibacter]